MLTDRHDQPISTGSPAARDAYTAGTDLKLTMYPGAIEAFDRAIAADPDFALPYVAKAHLLVERGNPAAGREALAAAQRHAGGVTARETSHIAYFSHLISGDSEAALAALPTHLAAWPRDVLVLGTTAFTNGLIGSSGRAGQKQRLLALLEGLAPHYADDPWFTAHHGMALSENGQHSAARPKIDQSLARNPANPWAAHANAHLSYETGDPAGARSFLTDWISRYPREAPLFSHLSWHLAIAHLDAGETASALRLFHDAFAPAVHSGPPRGKLNDPVSFLWRWELAGHPRDTTAWVGLHDFVNATFPRAGAAFSDMHIALTHAVAGNAPEVDARRQQIADLAGNGGYPSGPCVPAVARAFAASEQGDDAAVIDALEPIEAELERIGGSHAQLDLIRFTLLRAYLRQDRTVEARRLIVARRRRTDAIPVAGAASLR